MPSEAEIIKRLAQAWHLYFGCDIEKVTPEAELDNDLEFGEIDRVDALLAAESEFDLVIDDDEAEECVTVAQWAAMIRRLRDSPAYAGYQELAHDNA